MNRDQEIKAALQQFAGTDQTDKLIAWGRLYELSRDALSCFLKYRVKVTGADAEDLIQDIVQDTFVKLWHADFADAGIPAWYKWLQTTARNRYLDIKRAQKPQDPLPQNQPADAEDKEWKVVLKIVRDARVEGIYYAANVLWLGLDPKLTADRHECQFQAALLYYCQGISCDVILKMLRDTDPGSPPLTQQTLEDWLEHPGLLRLLAFHELYYSNDRLAACLLGLCDTAPDLEKQLQDVVKTPPPGLTCEEVDLLLRRYRYNQTVDTILARVPYAQTAQEINALLVRFAERLPFSSKIVFLLQHVRDLKRRAQLDKPGLWQRLAFQYHYSRDEVPINDILERIRPAAQHVDYTLNQGQLNVWLSGNRLLDRLIKHYRSGGGSTND